MENLWKKLVVDSERFFLPRCDLVVYDLKVSLLHRLHQDHEAEWVNAVCEDVKRIVSTANEKNDLLRQTEYDDDQLNYIIAVYCRELWCAEGNVQDAVGGTVDIAVKYLRGMATEAEQDTSDKFNNPRIWTKIKNVIDTATRLFRNGDWKEFQFDLESISQIHQQIYQGLGDGPGNLRIRDVKPLGFSEHYYTKVDNIEIELKELLRFVQQRRVDVKHLEEAVVLAGFFMDHFLKIHPFENGNGRVARLLVSILLAPFTVTPVALYEPYNETIVKTSMSPTNPRDYYISALHRCREDKSSRYIVRFIWECMYRHVHEIGFVMDISNSPPSKNTG